MMIRTLLLLVIAGIGPSVFAQAPRTQIIEELVLKLEPTRTIVYKTVATRDLHLHLFEPAGHKPTVRPASAGEANAIRTFRPSNTRSSMGAAKGGGVTASTSKVDTTAR